MLDTKRKNDQHIPVDVYVGFRFEIVCPTVTTWENLEHMAGGDTTAWKLERVGLIDIGSVIEVERSKIGFSISVE